MDYIDFEGRTKKWALQIIFKKSKRILDYLMWRCVDW